MLPNSVPRFKPVDNRASPRPLQVSLPVANLYAATAIMPAARMWIVPND